MKKLLLAALGLTGVLASCGDGGTMADSTPPTLTNASGLYTNHKLTVTATDVDTGTVYPAGTYVICDNRNTTIELSVSWTGQLWDLDLFTIGGYYGSTYDYLGSYAADGRWNGSGTISYTFGPNAAPLSLDSKLSAQAITVNPVTAIRVKGFTGIAVQGNSYTNVAGNYLTAKTLNSVNVDYLPVVDCQ